MRKVFPNDHIKGSHLIVEIRFPQDKGWIPRYFLDPNRLLASIHMQCPFFFFFFNMKFYMKQFPIKLSFNLIKKKEKQCL